MSSIKYINIKGGGVKMMCCFRRLTDEEGEVILVSGNLHKQLPLMQLTIRGIGSGDTTF